MLGLLWLVILLATGYLLTFFLFRKQDFLERFVCGLGLSLFLLVLFGFLLNFWVITGLTVRLAVGVVFVLTILSLFVSKRYKFVTFPRMNVKRIVSLVGCVVLVFVIIYFPHFSYKYPLHGNEYWYMVYAHGITEKGHLCYSPYAGSYNCDAKTGFTILLANIFMLAHLDPLLDYRFMPAVFGVITALVLFVFIYELTKSFGTGLLAMLLFATLKGNMLVLGSVLAVPFTVSMSLAFLFLYLVYRYNKEKSSNYLILSMIVLFTTFTIHGSAAAYMLAIAIFYSSFNLRENWKVFIPAVSLTIALSAVLFLIWFWTGGIKTAILENLWRVMLPPTIIRPPYASLIGIPLMTFVWLGLYKTISTKNQRILALLLVVSFIYHFVAIYVEHAFVIRTERLLYIRSIAAILVGSIGFSYFLALIKNKIRQKYVVFMLAAIILVFIFYFQFKTYTLLGFDHISVNDEEYLTLEWLKEHYSGKKVFANPLFSLAIPITNNTVVTQWMSEVEQSAAAEKLFESPSCEEGLQWIDRYKPDLVISRIPFFCNFLNEVQTNRTGYFIYEVKKEI